MSPESHVEIVKADGYEPTTAGMLRVADLTLDRWSSEIRIVTVGSREELERLEAARAKAESAMRGLPMIDVAAQPSREAACEIGPTDTPATGGA